jgi:hypothetical protein
MPINPSNQILGLNGDGTVREVAVDAEGNLRTATAPAAAPENSTPALISADTPLSVGSHDTVFVIPDGEVFHLQRLIASNEDPTKGARITILCDDGVSEHVVFRAYYAGFVVPVELPDTSEARDGTSLFGDGSTKTIILRREKLVGANIEIDAQVQGYTK